MFYIKMDQVNFPFDLYLYLCSYGLQYIDTEGNYFNAVDLDSGYW